jgi:hypothetical protein
MIYEIVQNLGGEMLMYTKGYLLKTDTDFDNAIHFRLILSIEHNGEHFGNGCIKAYNDELVKMKSGEWFNKFYDFTVVSYAAFYEPD